MKWVRKCVPVAALFCLTPALLYEYIIIKLKFRFALSVVNARRGQRLCVPGSWRATLSRHRNRLDHTRDVTESGGGGSGVDGVSGRGRRAGRTTRPHVYRVIGGYWPHSKIRVGWWSAGGVPIKTNNALPLFFLPCSGYYFKPGPHSAAAEANLDF